MPQLQELGLGAAHPRRGQRITVDTELALRWVAALLVAATATELAIRYALRRHLLDQPGQRRSHRIPTPRGGGIAIVVAVLGCALPLLPLAPSARWLLAAAIAAVAGIGWWDDHRSLSARARLAVQAPAALALAWLLWPWAQALLPLPAALAAAAFVVLSTLWAINLHNFMDGINGLLTLQAAWIFGMLAVLDAAGLPHGLGAAPMAMAAACLGFLPFNFPRARIFLGDVGSGALGLLVAAVLWLALQRDLRWAGIGLLLGSTFFIDATATLLSRFWRGRRWYSAHREHLYQWLVRSGRTHARVVSYYMAWNLLLVAPLALAAAQKDSAWTGLGAAAGVYALGVFVWCRARQAALNGVRRHA